MAARGRLRLPMPVGTLGFCACVLAARMQQGKVTLICASLGLLAGQMA